MKTYILCIETSTNVCSVALSKDGTCVSVSEETEFKSHTEKLTLLIKQCLDKEGISLKDLSAVCISEGPGSYTGLRIGASSAKGLCLGLDIPLIAINSLFILAQGVQGPFKENEIIVSAIDARRSEVYAMLFKPDFTPLTPTVSLILDEPNIITSDYGHAYIHASGNGSEKLQALLPNEVNIHQSKTSASFMCKPAYLRYQGQEFNDLITFSPYYFKNPNITKRKKKFFN